MNPFYVSFNWLQLHILQQEIGAVNEGEVANVLTGVVSLPE